MPVVVLFCFTAVILRTVYDQPECGRRTSTASGKKTANLLSRTLTQDFHKV